PVAEAFSINHLHPIKWEGGEPAILNLKKKRAGRSFLRMSTAGMMLSSPHGRVYGVPQKAFPSPK
ncbi:MAG: hypothetical protein Q8K07_14585, partial [Methylicorpusculum sp.]|uniref:hypothetical protein n=1 Tax=Methylicorpusculum sp. TaxID=2713644 RepID=UPI002730EBAF